MEFRLLGPLEALDGGTQLALGGRKPRALLARLLIDANRTVPVKRLVDDLWGEDVPGSAVKMVQIYVSQLRKVLPAGLLRTQAPGYVVLVEPEAVDLGRFDRLRSEGRTALEAGDAAAATALLADALALWRGPALAEFSEPFARVEGAHLEEVRLACLEDRIEADLAGGRHADVTGELEALAARHPLRERLHRQLIVALYRAGRQAEALAAYERFRRTLDDKLGIEPSAALKRLQGRILNQDPTLDARPAAPAAERRPRPSPEGRPAGGLVGRLDELAELETLLDAAAAGSGTTVLVAGRAGIGKSRLVAELAERAEERGAAVLGGRCIQLVGVGLPYLPFADALRPVAASPALAPLAGRLHELPRLVPELAEANAPGLPEADRTDSRLRLFQEVALVLEALSAEGPLVLALEDLHWADASTLDLLAFLTHGPASGRVLVVGTFRSEAVGSDHPLHRLAAGAVTGRAAVSLELHPLAGEAIAELVRARGETPPLEPVVEAIVARAEGNALFAGELAAAAARGEASLPPALRDMLLADVARLGPSARSALRVAAAAGRDVSYELLAAVTPLDELALAEALREAVEHDVLGADQAAGTFRFRHALFAEALYETLLPGEREVLHERIARALTEEPRLAMRGAAGEAAQHWAAARRPGEALAASLQAAKEAEEISGLTEALGYLERVLSLWDDVPDPEALTGAALPAILSRAAELASLSAGSEDESDLRRVVAVLDFDAGADADTVAARLGIAAEPARRRLAELVGSGLVELADDGYRAAPLAVTEARRLYPAAVVLESVAVRRSTRFGRKELADLRDANASLRAAVGDPAAAVAADDEFHRLLTAGCGNDELVAALLPIKRALLRYELVFMADGRRIERSAAQHDAIVAALERGEHGAAAQLLRENLAYGLPELTEAVELT